MSTSDHSHLLQQLQKEVNSVLEQTARVLATANSNNKAVTGAQATKLNQILPGSTKRFHEALDGLEDELHMAKLVMRRDLAVARERAGISKPVAKTAEGSVKRKSPDMVDTPAEQSEQSAKRVKLTPPDDAKPSAAAPSVEKTKVPPPKPEIETRDESKSAEDLKNAQKKSASTGEMNGQLEATPTKTPAKDVPSIPPPKPQPAPAEVPTADSNPAEPALQIDTKPNPALATEPETQPNSAKAPDTAATNDLDSLFGDPTASASAADIPTAEANPSTGDFAPNDDFGFGLPSADPSEGMGNDNIASLLPGLEDYANGEPVVAADVDFDFFSADLGGGIAAAQPSQTQTQVAEDGQVDDTFADFMNYDFGSGQFDGAGGNGNEDESGDGMFDFKFT